MKCKSFLNLFVFNNNNNYTSKKTTKVIEIALSSLRLIGKHIK